MPSGGFSHGAARRCIAGVEYRGVEKAGFYARWRLLGTCADTGHRSCLKPTPLLLPPADKVQDVLIYDFFFRLIQYLMSHMGIDPEPRI